MSSYRQQSLARRLLGADLVPLVASAELSEELYDLVALALRAFVNTWWTKLTRYDKAFLPQITAVLTHVVRALEHRLHDADLSRLVFGDIPALVTQHYRDYRQAAAKSATSYATGGALSLPQLFHQLQPHMAVSADGSIDEEYFRQAVDHILRECLAPEDYAPEAERFIIREIILKVVVKDVIPLVTRPWFLQKMVLDMLGPGPGGEQPASDARLSKSGVVVFLLSAIQKFSGMCIMLIHAYKQAIHIIPIVNQTRCSHPESARATPLDISTPSASPTPSTESSTDGVVLVDLTRGPLEMVSEVLLVQNRLAATAVVQLVLLCCRTCQTFMNKLLCYLLYTHVLSTSSILAAVRLSKQTLFPNGYPGPPPVDPTPEEQVAIRERLVKRLSQCVPVVVLGDPATTLDGAVDALSDGACNRHLAVFLFDAVLLTVFPEMF